MSQNLEDLYLKGFMAFSAKDYPTAKKHWEQVLSMDPDHERARQGLAQMGASAGATGQNSPQVQPKKRTSKEVLAEIKRLYSEKKFGASLDLCRKLVAKHPNNEDLKGLLKKIEARYTKQQGAALTGESQPDIKSTQQFAADAEIGMDAEPAAPVPAERDEAQKQAEVAQLIQQGVSLYEIQDYDRAIATWRQAIALDPGNKIAQDYIANVSPLAAPDETSPDLPDPTAAPTPAPAASAPAAPQPAKAEPASPTKLTEKPTKEEMIGLYNQAMGLYKEKRFPEAIDLWRRILDFYPNHKETLHCIERAEAAMDKVRDQTGKYKTMLDEARASLASGNQIETERIITRLEIEAPNLDGLADLRQKLDERQQQINEIRSLEIEEQFVAGSGDSSVSDDELQRFFTPESSEPSEAMPRQVSRVVRPRTAKKPTSKWILIGIPAAVIVLGVASFFGYQAYRQAQVQPDDPIFAGLVREVNWNGDEQKAEDFLIFANDFRDEGDFLLASFAYERARDIAKPRHDTLALVTEADRNFEVTDEMDRLEEILGTVDTNYQIVLSRISPAEVPANALSLAEAELKRERWQEGAERLMAILTADTTNSSVREKLATAYESLALEKLAANELDEASQLFRKVAVLNTSYALARRHIETIQRYFDGRINEEDKDHWFFFFTN